MQFFFINKSERSTCLSRSAKVEKAAAQKHIQTGRARYRVSKTATWRVGPPASATRILQCQAEDRQRQISYINSKQSILTKWSYLKHNSQEKVPIEASRQRKILRKCPGSFPNIVPRASSADPFHTSSIRLDKVTMGLLHYYIYYYHPTIWPNEMAVLRRGLYIFENAVNNIMKLAFSSKLAMCSILSAAACRLQFIDKLPCQLVVRKEVFYIQEALRLIVPALRKKVETNEGVQDMLVCMLFLLSAESYRDNDDAAEVHLRGIYQLLQPMGGLLSIDNATLKGQIAMADLYLACIRLEPCLFDCVYDPGPTVVLLLEDNELLPDYRESQSALSLLARTDVFIPPSLLIVIREIAESFAIKCSFQMEQVSPQRAMQVSHWITLRNMAIRHKLLAYQTRDARLHALRVALIMWTLLAMNVTGRTKTVKLMAVSLQRLVSSISPSSWDSGEDIKFWMLLLGLQCVVMSSEAASWFKNETIRYINQTWSDISPHTVELAALASRLEHFQSDFFFHAQTQRSSTMSIAEMYIHSII